MPSEEVQDQPAELEEQNDALTASTTVSEDAYVRDGSYRNRNYKSATTLSVRSGSSSSQNAYALLKFDLTSVSKNVNSATLRLYGSASAATQTEVRGFVGNWSESSVTYANAPQLPADAIAWADIAGQGLYQWDVTSFVRANAGKKVTLAVLATRAANITFNSREAGSNVPTLRIDTSDSTGGGSNDAGTGGGSNDAGTGGGSNDAGTGGGSNDAGTGGGSNDAGTGGGSNDAGTGGGSNDAGTGGGSDAGSSCTPRVCGTSCGSIDDGCGKLLSCGACPVPTDPTTMSIGANFWRHTWGNGPGDYFKSGVNFATTTDPWQPQLISDLSYAKVLRFMDWGPTNGSRFVNWSDRVLKTADQTNAKVQLSAWDGATETGEGVAYEWQIDLANRVNADFWVNIPHAANDEFVRELAKLLQAQLKSDKKIYIEYSNEVWNGGFYQHKYCNEQAAKLGMPATMTYQGKTVYLDGWLAFSTMRSLQVFDIFEQVFGANNPRLVKVIAGQLDYQNWPDYVSTWGDVSPLVIQHMAVLHNATLNPKGMKVNAYAVAPYWSGANVNEMRTDLNNLAERMAEATRGLEGEGSKIKLVCYEGGQDGANQPTNAKDPAIYQLTKDAYTKFKPFIKGPFIAYTHVGWDGTYAWGLKQSTTSTLAESHKYRATLDWARENP